MDKGIDKEKKVLVFDRFKNLKNIKIDEKVFFSSIKAIREGIIFSNY